jgi:hypothetical protein
MDGKAFQWDGSLDGEIGWAAYLTRKWKRWRLSNAVTLLSLPRRVVSTSEQPEKKLA